MLSKTEKHSIMNSYKIIILFVLVLLQAACTNSWEEHTKVNQDVLEESILNYLEENAEFSQFTEMVKSSGMDTYFNSSTIYTVWAPTNDALSSVDQSLLDSDAKIKMFVQNHFVNGMYSTLSDNPAISIKMKSGKVLVYDSSNDLIDGVNINSEQEATLKNGVVQAINSALAPRYSIWDYILFDAPQNKFVQFLQSQTKLVFDDENSQQIGVNEQNQPVYDTIWIEENRFFNNAADLNSEDSILTVLIPTDDVFEEEFNKFQKYYRRDDKVSNEVPTTRDSIYIQLMIARDYVFENAYSVAEAPDTLVSYFNVKVPFKSNAITASYQASNGYVYVVNDCQVEVKNKILPIVMEAETSIYGVVISASGNYLNNTTSGTATPYFRERADASQGYDLVVDNSHKSEVLSGALFRGPLVSSIKYRVKIRAINDFNKSYRYSNSGTPLKQWLGQVTITRNKVTEEIIAISPATNAFNSGTEYGVPDVTYDPADPSTYYVSIDSTRYSPIENALDDEIDLGYFNFSKADSVFFRLIPESSQMAVSADYFRLVPIFE